jgi:hypothetical protein
MPEHRKAYWYHRPVLKCDFYWESTTLQKAIKAYKRDYKPEDPWAWPYIESKAHSGYCDHTDKSSLPLSIECPPYIVEAFTRRDHEVQIKQTKTGNKVTVTMFSFISHISTMRRTTSVRMACSMLFLVRSGSRARLVSLLLLLGWRGWIIKSSFHQLKLSQKISKW